MGFRRLRSPVEEDLPLPGLEPPKSRRVLGKSHRGAAVQLQCGFECFTALKLLEI